MPYLKTINFPEFSKIYAAAEQQFKKDKTLVINNDEDKKFFKAERAQRNKFLKAFAAEAAAVRKKNIGDFDEKVKQIKTLVDENQKLLADKVSEYDETWLRARQNFVREAISLRITEALAFVTPGQLYDPRYLNTTTTEKKIITDLDSKVEKIKSDYQVAQSVNAQVAELFKQTLDVAQAIRLDKAQREQQERREAIERAEQARREREQQEREARQKELERQAMVQAQIDEAKSNGEVLDAETIRDINLRAEEYAEKEAVKTAEFTVKFTYKESDYAMAWENPQADLEYRLEGLQGLEVTQK